MAAVMKNVVGCNHLAVKMGKNRKNRPDGTPMVLDGTETVHLRGFEWIMNEIYPIYRPIFCRNQE
jgi:hypothetical protein